MGRGNLFLKKRKVIVCLLAAVFLLGEILTPARFLKVAAASKIEISVVTVGGVQKKASGSNLATALGNLSGIKASQIKRLDITGGPISEADWIYIFEHNGNDGSEDLGQFSNLTDFSAKGTGGGSSVIPNVDRANGNYDKNFPRSIERMKIPNGITTIGEGVFFRCDKLQELSVPNSVEMIGRQAFDDCSNLVEVKLPEKLEEIGDFAFANCEKMEQIEIPDSVTEIGFGAFEWCESLNEVILPQNLTTIKGNTFARCYSLKKITIPDGVTTIELGAFYYCMDLRSVTIPDSVTTIEYGAFYFCRDLNSITIPDHVTTIGASAFANCNGLREVVFPKSLQSIGAEAHTYEGAFANCTKLTKVVIPGNVKEIGNGTFSGCRSLEEVVMEEGIETIGMAAFRETDIKNIVIPGNVKTISAYTFNKCSNLEEVTISEGVENIGIYAFADCDSLTELTLPSSVKLLSPFAFENCSNLSVLKLFLKSEEEVAAINTHITTEDISYSPFENVPTPRKIYFYTEEGLPLSASTVPAFSDAVAAYRAEKDDDTSDNLWWGWQMEEAYSVISHLTNLTGSNKAALWRENDEDYTTTLAPAASTGGVAYTLPAEVVVKIGDRTASSGEDYTYDPATGILLIKASSIDGNIEIEAAADLVSIASPTPEPTPTESPTPSSSPEPTASPTPEPTASPTQEPTVSPTLKPTASPTPEPAVSPTPDPTVNPTPDPTPDPTPTPVPDKDISDIADGLGVSGDTAEKIQEVAKELDVSKDTILVTDQTITSQKTDNDVKGAYFARIQARVSQITENNIKLVWNKVKGADGYLIYGNQCNTRKIIHEYKLVKTITNSNKRSYIERKCKKGSYYKFIVRAYKNIDGKKVTIAVSKTIHVVTNGGKNGNARSVKINKGKLSLKKGKTFRLKAKEIKQKKKLRYHRKVCYESSDPKVASVSKKGVIKARKKGKCTIFVYAQNGIYKKVKITIN